MVRETARPVRTAAVALIGGLQLPIGGTAAQRALG